MIPLPLVQHCPLKNMCYEIKNFMISGFSVNNMVDLSKALATSMRIMESIDIHFEGANLYDNNFSTSGCDSVLSYCDKQVKMINSSNGMS